jgi:hypothetical protein
MSPALGAPIQNPMPWQYSAFVEGKAVLMIRTPVFLRMTTT